MDKDSPPTIRELAEMLDSITFTDPKLESRFTTLWLIQQVPATREMWEAMTKNPGDGPSMMELAELVLSVVNEGVFHEAVGTALWLIDHIPVTRDLMQELERLKADARPINDSYRWEQILNCHEQLDRLVLALESGQDWAHPSEVLDVRRSWGFDLQGLYNICVARLARADGPDKFALQAAKKRLKKVLKKGTEWHR